MGPQKLNQVSRLNNMSSLYIKNIKNNEGFTLIELLLYISIASIMLLTIVSFLNTLLEARIKNQTIMEVESQGSQVMQVITQSIRNAEGITSPSAGASETSLILDVVASTDDPTTFDVSGGSIRITEGVTSAVSLTNDRVTVSNFNITNLSQVNTPGIVRVEFTVTHVNPEGRFEYGFNKTFYNSASLR